MLTKIKNTLIKNAKEIEDYYQKMEVDLDSSLVETILSESLSLLEVGDELATCGDDYFKIDIDPYCIYDETIFFDYEDPDYEGCFDIEKFNNIKVSLVDEKYVHIDAWDTILSRELYLGRVPNDKFINAVRKYIETLIDEMSTSIDVYESIKEWIDLTL